MIVPNLKGGLGNQMFQIAAAYAVAKRAGVEYGINYNLQHNLVQGNTSHHYRNNLFKNIPAVDNFPDWSNDSCAVYKEPHFHYTEIPVRSELFIDGYFQSSKYFNEFADDVRNLWYWPQEVVDKVDGALEKVRSNGQLAIGVHVRRGDYIRFQSTHPLQPSGYYDDAFDKLEEEFDLDPPDYTMLLCTDDISTVGMEFDLSDYIWANGTEISDLYLLSQCDGVIMSNSSFAWWGAWLSSKKMVVAPKNWFGPDGPQDFQDIYEPNWLLM